MNDNLIKAVSRSIANVLEPAIRRLAQDIAQGITQNASAIFQRLAEDLARQLGERWAEQLTAAVRASLSPLFKLLDELFAPGTLDGDLRLVMTKRDLGALERLALRLRWYPKDPQAVIALKRRTEELGGEAAYSQTFMTAFVLAVGRYQEKQRVRLGRRYVKTDGGEMRIQPKNLSVDEFWLWLRKETVNAMEADLLDKPYPTGTDDEFEPLPEDLKGESGAESALLLKELQTERREYIARLAALLTPAELELLAVLSEGTKSLTAAAAALNRKPSTVRNQWASIRRKAASLSLFFAE